MSLMYLKNIFSILIKQERKYAQLTPPRYKLQRTERI